MQFAYDRQQIIRYWLPALAAGGAGWLLLLIVGETPVVRASGLALVLVGLGLALRRMGAVLTIIGSLTLAFSPAFWSQTGGAEGDPARIVIAVAAATVALIVAALVSRRPYIGLGLGIIVFVALFSSQIGTPRSLRLTSFVVAWLMYLLVDMLLLTNPHPESQQAPPILRYKPRDGDFDDTRAQPYHTLGILLLFGVGVLNDPLLTLFAPAIGLALFLSNTRLGTWYWALFALVIGIGLRGLEVDYLQAQSHLISLASWRDGARWLDMIQFVTGQFTLIGIGLGVLGLARLARWYPPLAITLMVAYAAYGSFGLVYSGSNRDVLLLPLLMIQVIWMTYAVFAFGEWASRTARRSEIAPLLIRLVYGLLPVILLLNILRQAS